MYDETALMNEFNDFLNETHDVYEICGIDVIPSEILKTDQIAYRQAFLDWCDSNGYEF